MSLNTESEQDPKNRLTLHAYYQLCHRERKMVETTAFTLTFNVLTNGFLTCISLSLVNSGFSRSRRVKDSAAVHD